MPIRLIVGLANPGKEYADTRHNAGAWFVDDVANLAKVALRQQSKFHGLYAVAHVFGHDVHLLVPTTFMNVSGQAIRACMNYLKISSDEVLVAHDDIDLPPDTVRLKLGGGDGGHNGLKDTIAHLHTKDFYRLRIGVGRAKHRDDMVDYVLNKPSKADRALIDRNIQDTLLVLPLILEGEMQKAMHKLHTIETTGDK